MRTLAPLLPLTPTAIYLGDRGRCFCGAHASMLIQSTGRDSSGQVVLRVTAADVGRLFSDEPIELFACKCGRYPEVSP